jgi:hypothetical protein
MKAVVIYESLTGNTRRVSGVIAEELRAQGVEATVSPITDIDYAALSSADLVLVGSWVDGIIVAGQRPGRAGRLRALPVMYGKRCAVFCTYAVHPGKTLEKMVAILRGRGAEVLGGVAIKRNNLQEGAREFVDRVLANVA